MEHDPQRDLGGHPRPRCAPRSPSSATATRPRRSASPTSARPSCSGTARPSARRAGRSSGRTGVRRDSATSCARTATSRASPRSPACASTPTSPRRSSPGSRSTSRTCGRRSTSGRVAVGTVDSYLVARLTRGLHHVTDASNAVAHAALRHPRRRLERRAVRHLRRAARRAARGRALLRRRSGAPTRACSSGSTSRSPASRATSRRRCSARPASPPGTSKCTYGTGSFVLVNTGDRPVASSTGLLTTVAWQHPDGRLDVRARGRGVRHRGRGAVAARRARRSSAPPPRPRSSPGRCPTPAAWSSCPRSPVWAPPTGTRTRAARSSASPAAPPARTWCARRSRPSPSRCRTSSTSWSARASVSVPELAVDGGASANGLLCQLQADAAQVPVARAAVLETTGMGAAFLAGLATGVWASEDEIAAVVHRDARFEPGRARRARRTAAGAPPSSGRSTGPSL